MENTDSEGVKAPRWGRRIAIMLTTAALALAGAELWVRWYWPVLGCVLEPDPNLLYRPIPNTARVQHMFDSPSVVVRINDAGLFGPEPDREDQGPTWLFLGDSFIMSENEPYENTFCARVDEAWGSNAGILCAGVTGYGPDQSLLRLEHLLPEWKPDGVCMVLCSYNDFGDLLRNNLFELDGLDHLQPRKATIHPQERQIFEQRLEESKGLGLLRLWKDSKRWRQAQVPNVNATFIADYLRAQREEYRAHRAGETLAFGLQRDVYDADVALFPESESSQYKLRLMGAILKTMKARCTAAGIPFVCVVVPGGVDLDPDNLLRIDPVRYPGYRPARLSELAAKASEDQGIPTLNLFGPLSEEAGHRDLYVGPVDPHWNAAGMELGARAFVEFMDQQGFVQKP